MPKQPLASRGPSTHELFSSGPPFSTPSTDPQGGARTPLTLGWRNDGRASGRPHPAGGAILRIAVLGLGHVGATNMACLAAAGHQLLGVDVNPDKVAAVAAGRSPAVEPLLDKLLRE